MGKFVSAFDPSFVMGVWGYEVKQQMARKERVFMVTVGELLLKLRYESEGFPAVESDVQSQKHRDEQRPPAVR
ncbi:hypothetical protein EYF80_060157 [Liparis tanakae]|uniref:Uncharacterized protein n=1 Tax=Liparis tanakae TaxID=230148 RepID=A0A4Z2ELG9_9TELE|nr:hypothetical protein EYF80_060157 [Liparis tanakae]